jgi:hypothetical protein
LSSRRRAVAVALGAILIAALGSAGCTNHCDARLLECQYDCSRIYQTCVISGADEEECARPYRNCWAACDNERRYCPR